MLEMLATREAETLLELLPPRPDDVGVALNASEKDGLDDADGGAQLRPTSEPHTAVRLALLYCVPSMYKS